MLFLKKFYPTPVTTKQFPTLGVSKIKARLNKELIPKPVLSIFKGIFWHHKVVAVSVNWNRSYSGTETEILVKIQVDSEEENLGPLEISGIQVRIWLICWASNYSK